MAFSCKIIGFAMPLKLAMFAKNFVNGTTSFLSAFFPLESFLMNK